jgi:hypothetical protein
VKLYTFSIKWLLTPKIESATAKLKEIHSLKRLWILEHSGDRAQTYDL